ncbi:MAG: hypothetical protein Q4D19_11665 [Lautropia sp.]|nr:hypothetical protein [Lautropia sp.]
MISPFRIITTTLVLSLSALLLPASADDQAPALAAPHAAQPVPANEHQHAAGAAPAEDARHADVGSGLSRNYLEPKTIPSSLLSGYFVSEAED